MKSKNTNNNKNANNKKNTILIVDDDSLICDIIDKELKRNFFSTFIANNGKEAFDILNKHKVDIILLDIFLPDISGMEMLGQIKKKWDNIEAVIITGHSSQEMAIKALRQGAIDYLEKPVNFEELNISIGRATEKIVEKANLIYRHSILLVDDEKELIERLARILIKEGYDVFSAYNGKEGFQICQKNKIDIIISDIEMPVMGGIEFLERIKKAQRDIEVIMMTGFGDENLAIEALRKGAINYLRKPIDLDELLIAIEQAIEKILLYRNQLYRNRELKINSEIVSKINEELEKRIEERTLEISQMQSQLFQTSKLATLGEMSAGLAHELNQPLTGILLSAANIKKLMDRDLLTDLEIEKTIKDIESLVKRMNKIIVHIRTFSRQDLLKFIKMNVNESIENALKLVEEQLRLQNIKVIKELDSGLPEITGEPYQIEQVALNVISNAKDSLNEKEAFVNEKPIEWSKKLEIKTFLKNNWVCVDFTDNGLGMCDETKEKIFQPFFTKKEVGKATGLGMSISYGIIKSHKGRIDVIGIKGEGVTISIKLPMDNL